jgi:hypothetical protein
MMPHHNGGNDASNKVGYRHTYPNAFHSQKMWKDEQTGYQKQYLSRDSQEYRFPYHSDTLKEVGSYHLKTR